MARCIEQIERAVAKIVQSVEAADLERFGVARVERDLAHASALHVGIQHDGVRVGGVPRPGGCFHTWTHDEIGGWGKARDVADVVEVVVRPDNGFDVAGSDVEPTTGGVIFEDGGHVSVAGGCDRGGVVDCRGGLDQGDYARG